MSELEFIKTILTLFGKLDSGNNILMFSKGRHGDEIYFSVMCNDTFYYSSADAETITKENLPILVGAFEDALKTVSHPWDLCAWGVGALFVGRVRKMRPLKLYYDEANKPLHELYNAIGDQVNE